jgi:hypothetical protein
LVAARPQSLQQVLRGRSQAEHCELQRDLKQGRESLPFAGSLGLFFLAFTDQARPYIASLPIKLWDAACRLLKVKIS